MSKKNKKRKMTELEKHLSTGRWRELNGAEVKAALGKEDHGSAFLELKLAKNKLNQLKAYLRQETIPFLKEIMKHAAQNEYDMAHRRKHIDSFNTAAQELRECIQGLEKYIRGIK